jgi:hypothetical protein
MNHTHAFQSCMKHDLYLNITNFGSVLDIEMKPDKYINAQHQTYHQSVQLHRLTKTSFCHMYKNWWIL